MPSQLPKQHRPTERKQVQPIRSGIVQPGNRAQGSSARTVESYLREHLPKDDTVHPGYSLSARNGGFGSGNASGGQPFVDLYSASLLQKPCSGPPSRRQSDVLRPDGFARAAAQANSLYQIRPSSRSSTSPASTISTSSVRHTRPSVPRRTALTAGASARRPIQRQPLPSPPQSVASPPVAIKKTPHKLVKRQVAEVSLCRCSQTATVRSCLALMVCAGKRTFGLAASVEKLDWQETYRERSGSARESQKLG